MLEKNLQSKCIKYLKDKKIYYVNKYGDGRTGKGTPDLLVCLNGRFVAFELKVGKNGLQDDQVIRKKQIEKSGGLVFSPTTINEFIEIIEEVANGIHYPKWENSRREI